MRQEIYADSTMVEARLREHLQGPGSSAVSMRLPLLQDYGVAENIVLARIIHWNQRPERAEAIAREALSRHDLEHISNRMPSHLSKRELFIALFLRAINMPRAHVLLDRPATDFGVDEADLLQIVALHVELFSDCFIVELDTGARFGERRDATGPLAQPGAGAVQIIPSVNGASS